ncbi:MAG: XisH protein [Deltaproteobacteria bacterium]|nr:XisH protein [Deltaproteobacteria bacterium]
MLKQNEPDRILYLAIAEYVYDNLFATEFGELATKANQLKLLVFDKEQEVIKQWLE